jgi:RNA polymerase sigma factor (sigma-70 family)
MNLNTVDEEKIINEILNDYEKGTYSLVNQYTKYLRDRAVSFGVTREDAEELVSDVLYNAIEKIRKGEYRFQGKGKLNAWLYESIKNKCLDKFKKEKTSGDKVQFIRYQEQDYDEDDGKNQDYKEAVLIAKTIASRFEENISEDDRKKIITDTLQELSEDQQFYIYCYLKGDKYQEIADMSNCSIEAAKKRVNRSMLNFCTLIAEKLNLKSKQIYENIKEIHRADLKGRIT